MIDRPMPRRTLLAATLLFLTACTAGSAGHAGRQRSFAELVQELSEPGGYFDTDNLISNEASYLHVLGTLERDGVRGGAYLGVGPGQNFSYIAAVEPAFAVIVDIRRDNLLLHLLFKALFEIADGREEYLALLVGRAPGVSASPDTASVERLIARLDATSPSADAARDARRRADSAIATFGVPLSEADRETIARFHRTFIDAGLGLLFRSHGRAPQPYYPTLRRLLLERDLAGRQVSFLADDARFGIVKRLHEEDRIIPVTGDFAGPHALRAIADELARRDLPVTAFYTSNVEFYLARQGTFGAWIENLAALPLARNAVVIRSIFRGPFGRRHPATRPGYASVQMIQDADDLLSGWREGRFRSYAELALAGRN